MYCFLILQFRFWFRLFHYSIFTISFFWICFLIQTYSRFMFLGFFCFLFCVFTLVFFVFFFRDFTCSGVTFTTFWMRMCFSFLILFIISISIRSTIMSVYWSFVFYNEMKYSWPLQKDRFLENSIETSWTGVLEQSFNIRTSISNILRFVRSFSQTGKHGKTFMGNNVSAKTFHRFTRTLELLEKFRTRDADRNFSYRTNRPLAVTSQLQLLSAMLGGKVKVWNTEMSTNVKRATRKGLLPDYYLTIRLRAWDFYEVIVDEGEARINYHLIEIESE